MVPHLISGVIAIGGGNLLSIREIKFVCISTEHEAGSWGCRVSHGTISLYLLIKLILMITLNLIGEWKFKHTKDYQS